MVVIRGTVVVVTRGVIVVVVTRGAVVVGATVVVEGIVTTGEVVEVTGSTVVVVVSRMVVVVATGRSASTNVETAKDAALLLDSFETIALFEMPGNAWARRAARPAT